MDGQRWITRVVWSEHQWEVRQFENTRQVTDYLASEAFRPRTTALLPREIQVWRVK